jgi:Flp pilus assembly pilin Flp
MSVPVVYLWEVAKMWGYFFEFLADESAISAVEYAALLALIGAGIMGAMMGLGDAISEDYSEAAASIAG